MAETRSTLGLVQINQIDLFDHSLSIKEDKIQLLQSLIFKHGQIKLIQCRKVGQRYECFEGRQILEAMKRCGFDYIHICNHGEITHDETLKIYYEIEALKTKFDILECAKLFKRLSEKHPLMELVKNVDMDINEVKDLIKLLEFDWDSMLNKKNNINQVSMFGDDE